MKDFAKHQLGTPHTINGVEGRLLQVPSRDGKSWDLQAFSATRNFPGEGGEFLIYLTFDKGSCISNLPYFSMRRTFDGITGPLDDSQGQELLSKHWPELAHLGQWNLCDVRGPLNYLDNAMYWAHVGDIEALKTTVVWQDMPEELTLPTARRELHQALVDRRPALIERFMQAMRDCGFTPTP